MSDGKDVGEPRILRVTALPLALAPVTNTGLVVARGFSALVTRDNLTYVTNAPQRDDVIEVRYEVTSPPYDGELQRQQYQGDG